MHHACCELLARAHFGGISSVIVNYLLKQRTKQPEIGVAFVYCESQEQANQTAKHLIGSLLQQLASESESVYRDIRSMY